MNTVLPAHIKTDPDELLAMILLEEIYHMPFLKSEAPDLHSKDKSIGCEVTRAYPIEYEKHNGKILSDIRNGDIKAANRVVSLNDDTKRIMIRIQERIIDKMHKLHSYKNYPKNYLYIKTLLWITCLELHELINVFDSSKKQIISECEKLYGSEYKEYHTLFIECLDTFIIWNWKNDKILLKPDIFDEYTRYKTTVFHLINDEINYKKSAKDNTPFKLGVNKLLEKT